MIILPSIDLLHGKVVKLVRGREGTGSVISSDPCALALKWQRLGAKGLHIVDLDAAFGKGDNIGTIERILAKACIPCQVGGGVRTSSRFQELVTLGASKVIVGTKGVEKEGWVDALAMENPGKVIVALDFKKGEVVVDGWRRSSGKPIADCARAVDRLPLGGLLLTNVEADGTLRGFDLSPISELMKVTRHEVEVAGGISSLDDLVKLKRIGVAVAIVGRALYEGKFSLREAQKLVE